MNIERKGKKEGEIQDRRNGKFAQLQRNTFLNTYKDKYTELEDWCL